MLILEILVAGIVKNTGPSSIAHSVMWYVDS